MYRQKKKEREYFDKRTICFKTNNNLKQPMHTLLCRWRNDILAQCQVARFSRVDMNQPGSQQGKAQLEK